MAPKRTAVKSIAAGGKRAISSTLAAPKRRRRAAQAPPKVIAPELNDSDSDEEGGDEPPVRASSGAYLVCLKFKPDEMAAGVAHLACLSCFRRCRHSIAVYGTFAELAEKLHIEAAVESHWAMAAKAEQSSPAASWFPSEVDLGTATELDIKRSMIGLDRAQIMSITDTIPPETLGDQSRQIEEREGCTTKACRSSTTSSPT